MRFILEIELGNEGMQTYADVLEAVRKGFDSVILEQLKPIKEAVALVMQAQNNTLRSSDYGWNKTKHVISYLSAQTSALEKQVEEYFADTVDDLRMASEEMK
jgi:hypothetical protein